MEVNTSFRLIVADHSAKGEGRVLGSIAPQIGMLTRMGKIIGFTPSGKSIRLEGENGAVLTIRAMDRLPGVALSEARKWGFTAK